MASSFRQLADRLGELATVPSRASRRIAERLSAELLSQFDRGVDPYGAPWKPLAKSTVIRKGHSTILVDTHRMELETMALPRGGAGVELVSTEVAGFHQFGTKNMPARPVLPSRAELPLAWQAIVREEIAAAYKQVLGR